MRTIRFPAANSVEVVDLPDPVAGPDEVVLRVRASGICHTDLEVMRGNYGTSAFPVVPGHEFAGEVADIGTGVVGVSIGDRVVVDPNLECGECRACGRGWVHLCEALGAYGVTTNGGFAEYCVVRADLIHPIGELDFATAALAEPMGCVLNGLSPLEGRRIERAVVFGTGPMGLLLGLALKARGTGEVLMVDRDRQRLDMAESRGLTPLAAGPETQTALRQSCDLAVDATGVPEVAGRLLDSTANGGAALFFGVCPSEARIAVSPFEVFRRQLSIFGTHSLNRNIPEALAALSAVSSDITGVVSHRLPFEEIADVMSGDGVPGSMKIQLAL